MIGKIWKSGDSLVLTIPKNRAEYEGLEEGSFVYVMIRKEK